MNEWYKWGGIAAASLMALAGCAGSADDVSTEAVDLSAEAAQSASQAPAQPFLVKVKEFSVTLSPKKLSAGTITFKVLNQGTELHEFVVVKTDLTPDELPTNPDGSFDEEDPSVEVIDEIEMIEPGTMERLTVALESGHYVLLCNRVEMEDDEVESHFAEGMHAELSVN